MVTQMEWKELISQYKNGKGKMDRYARNLKVELLNDEKKSYDEKINLSENIAKELGTTIRDLKQYHLMDCKRFILQGGGDCLSKKQRAVFELRMKGCTFEQIGKFLGISKTAAYKTCMLCEKKMIQIMAARKVNKIPANLYVEKGDLS